MGSLLGAAAGGGKFSTPDYVINPAGYANPVGNQAGNWQTGMKDMLGQTMFNRAAQAYNTNLQAASAYGGANLGKTAQSAGANNFGGAQLNAQQYGQTFGQEQGLANQYAKMAQGQGPSAATVQAKQSAEQSLANQMAMLGSQRGSANPAMAAYQAQQAGAQAMGQAAQQAVAGKTQEELGALGAQSGLLGSMNQQAVGFAGANANLAQQAAMQSQQMNQQNQQYNAGQQNAMAQAQAAMLQQAGLANTGAANQYGLTQGQLNQQTNLANLTAQQNQSQMNNNQYNQYMAMLQAQNLAQFQANQNYQAAGLQEMLGASQINSGAQQNFEAQMGQGFQQGISAGEKAMSMMGGSDRRLKKSIKHGDKEINDFLDNISLLVKGK